ncbi:8540_t:CDS:2 [Gigaspora margarita]|uniref:8540_t:CDS:1 n=1 Tax=Gigaspora margarita TaxID=4874 RepID=A0ABN7VCE0_GIGMA|nr:8540_t:CDS:2 [Gigaspora margarita]
MNLNISEQPLNTEASVLTTNILNERNSILPEYISAILPLNYDYSVSEIQQLPVYITTEGFAINQFEANLYVNINNVEDAHKWFCEFEEISKTTMPQSKGYNIQGKKIIFREIWHCIHSNMVRQKQGNPVLKKPNSIQIRNTGCMATIHLRLEHWRLQTLHLLLFTDGHSPATALYAYEDNLYLQKNGKSMFQRLIHEVNTYNNSGKGYTVFQEYDSQARKAFILCIIMNLMIHVHEKIQQSEALPLGLLVISDELEATLKRGLSLLKTLLLQYAFFGRGPNVGPMVFLTDDSSAECNALEYCWPQSSRFLCVFHVLQSFWRWLHNSKHGIDKNHKMPIMKIMRRILYAQSEIEIIKNYNELKFNYYHIYLQLQRHFKLLWSRKQYWALLFHSGLLIHGNNTNNYVKHSFELIKNIIFSCTKAYNSVQAIDAKEIQQTKIDTEYLVPSQEKGTELFYTVNTEFCTCTCFVELSGALCKHQGAVAAKYQIGSLNFLPSLTPSDHACFAYIARELMADSSFYASLNSCTNNNQNESYKSIKISSKMSSNISDEIYELENPNIDVTQVTMTTTSSNNIPDETHELENSNIDLTHFTLTSSSNYVPNKTHESEKLNIDTTQVTVITDNSNEEFDETHVLEKLNIDTTQVNMAAMHSPESFELFLETLRKDYETCGPQLQAALEKLAERYNAAKDKSIPVLTSFLYNVKSGSDPIGRVKSGAKIHVQVESVKHRKTRLNTKHSKEKENNDPHIIPARKVWAVKKKKHNISQNINDNQMN